MSESPDLLNGHTATLSLTRQQAHVLREFGPSHCPQQQSSETLAICGVREWPTCDNLIKLGLIDRVAWEGDFSGWLYEITVAGREALREMER